MIKNNIENTQMDQIYCLYFSNYYFETIGFLQFTTIVKSFKFSLRISAFDICKNLLSVICRSGIIHASEIIFLIQLAEQYSKKLTILSKSALDRSYQTIFKFLRSNYLRASQSGFPMYMNLLNLRFAALSSYLGRLVAPITSTYPPFGLFIPSISTKNQVFNLLEAQFYFSLRAVSMESIQSIKIMEGAHFKAASKIFFIVFYDYPTYLLRTDEAESAKNVQPDSLANALQMNVLPFPGGPYNNSPLGGARIPTQRSGLFRGLMTAYSNIDFASSNPAISLNETSRFFIMSSSISGSITIFLSGLFILGTRFL